MLYLAIFNIKLLNIYHVLIGSFILIAGIIGIFSILNLRKNNIKIEDDDEIEIAGFAYEEDQDIFYSVINAWQRDYGYCHFYDEMACPLSMIVDAEPVVFEYDDKLWLIELWKGQYGMTTGAEIGVYNIEVNSVSKKKINKILFNSVSDDEMLEMSYVLYKNDEIYFERFDKHWWLTGFKLGDFATPEELKMNISIDFKNAEMCDAFANRLSELGYTSEKLAVINNSVSILFDKPHSKKPYMRMKWLENFSQKRNKFFVDIYKEVTKEADSLIDKINLLKQKKPKLYKKIMRIGISKKVYASIAYLKNGKKKAGE